MITMLSLPLLMCLALAGILGYLGVHVLKREVIFIDIAIAQLAAVGAIAAHLAFRAHMGSLLGFLVSFSFVLLAAAFYAFARKKVAQIPVEAVIGVSYAITAAGALFLVGVAPGGHVHVQHMLAGSILWVTWRDVFVCVSAFVAVGGLFRLFRGPLTRISDDYDGAKGDGLNVVVWDFVFYALCGLVIALAVRVSGIVLVFAFLIIPATISAVFSSNWRTRLLAAWAAGFAASLLGLLFAYRLNFSMGPSVAMFLGIELAAAGAWSLRPSRVGAIVASAGSGVLLVVLLLAGPVVGTPSASPGAELAPPAQPPVHEGHAPHDERSAEDFPEPLDFSAAMERLCADVEAGTVDTAVLKRLFEKAPDEMARGDVIARALGVDVGTGVGLTLDFLRRDPPLFFRQAAVEKLEEVTGKPSGLAPEEPFSAPANREAAARLRAGYKSGGQ